MLSGSVQPQTPEPELQEQYCAVAALYMSARLYAMPASLPPLLDTQFVSTPSGSTLFDIERAAATLGLRTLVLENLSAGELRRSNYPVLLHVRRTPSLGREFNHFVLYIGLKDGQAWIYDAPEKPFTESFEELSARWGGTGVAVAPESVSAFAIWKNFHLPATPFWLVSASVILGLLIVARSESDEVRASDWRFQFARAGRQCALIFCASFVLALVVSVAAEGGPLSSGRAHATNFEVRPHLKFPSISSRKVRSLMRRPGAIIIDARDPGSYAMGHIQDAISVPVGSGPVNRAAAVRSIAKGARIVVYCQSLLCPYSDEVAARLDEDGFKNISIYRGGWADWERAGR